MIEERGQTEPIATLGDAYRPGNSAPWELWILAAILAAGAVLITPERLIQLGPMRQSLTADNELTRETALGTVRLGRVALAIGASGVVALIVLWRTFIHSRLCTLLCREAPPAEASGNRRVMNPSFWVSVGAFAASVVYVALAPSLLSRPQRLALAREDGILEQGTALLFLSASILSAIVAWKLFRQRPRGAQYATRRAIWHTLIGLFFFVCFGEEISWGQRILGIETPESLRTINVQGELNLHNMMGYFADQFFILGMFVYGALLPFLGNRYEFWRRSLYWLGLPLASIGLAVGFALASSVHGWTLYAVLPPEAGVRAAELREFLTALCCALLMVESLQFVARSRLDDSPRNRTR